MRKRGVERSWGELNFLGFKCKEKNRLDTHIRGGFGVSSDWPHLHHLISKLNLKLVWERRAENLMECGSVCV